MFDFVCCFGCMIYGDLFILGCAFVDLMLAMFVVVSVYLLIGYFRNSVDSSLCWLPFCVCFCFLCLCVCFKMRLFAVWFDFVVIVV